MKNGETEEMNPLTAGLRLPVWRIEVFLSGIWETQDTAHSEEDALMLASSLAEHVREDCIRIRTPAGHIL